MESEAVYQVIESNEIQVIKKC